MADLHTPNTDSDESLKNDLEELFEGEDSEMDLETLQMEQLNAGYDEDSDPNADVKLYVYVAEKTPISYSRKFTLIDEDQDMARKNNGIVALFDKATEYNPSKAEVDYNGFELERFNDLCEDEDFYNSTQYSEVYVGEIGTCVKLDVTNVSLLDLKPGEGQIIVCYKNEALPPGDLFESGGRFYVGRTSTGPYGLPDGFSNLTEINRDKVTAIYKVVELNRSDDLEDGIEMTGVNVGPFLPPVAGVQYTGFDGPDKVIRE